MKRKSQVKLKWIKALYVVYISFLIVFMVISSVDYEKFNGDNGEGYSIEFSLTKIAMVSGLLIFISLPIYYKMVRKVKNSQSQSDSCNSN